MLTDDTLAMSWIEEQPESNRKLLDNRLLDAPVPEHEVRQATPVVGIDASTDKEGPGLFRTSAMRPQSTWFARRSQLQQHSATQKEYIRIHLEAPLHRRPYSVKTRCQVHQSQ